MQNCNRYAVLAAAIGLALIRSALAQANYEPYEIRTLAGVPGVSGIADGTGVASRIFGYPAGVARDSAGNLFVADGAGQVIRKISPSGEAIIYAGTEGVAGTADGVGIDAQFNYPEAVAVDAAGDLYVADFYNHTIRKITPERRVTTLAGQAGTAGSADGSGISREVPAIQQVWPSTRWGIFT